jgi:hypothetical protein
MTTEVSMASFYCGCGTVITYKTASDWGRFGPTTGEDLQTCPTCRLQYIHRPEKDTIGGVWEKLDPCTPVCVRQAWPDSGEWTYYLWCESCNQRTQHTVADKYGICGDCKQSHTLTEVEQDAYDGVQGKEEPNDVFGIQRMQEPVKDPAWDKALDLARQYHTACEAFDKGICTLRTEKGIAMPANGTERRAINMNAQVFLERILTMAEAGAVKVPKDLLHEAIIHQAREQGRS